MLKQPITFNLLIDRNTNQILTAIPLTTSLVSWKKIIKAVYNAFLPMEEKMVYMTTSTGLAISIVIANNEESDLEVIKIDPQTTSSISLYRGVIREEVSLRGYDEDEIIESFKEKLGNILSSSSALANG
jgi:hypothetical protein